MKIFFLALLCCLSLATARAGDGPITQITVQHTECYGPCPIDSLTLNADGSAEFGGRKNAVRQGLYRGQIAPAAFAELANFLEEQNFFEMRPEIGDGNIDASDTIISATRGKLPDCVVFRTGTRDKMRVKFGAAFARASAQIDWKRDASASQSGVSGSLMRDTTPAEAKFAVGTPSATRMPMRFTSVYLTSLADLKISYSTRTNAYGQFEIFAPPGRYSLSALDFNLARPFEIGAPRWNGESVNVEIKADEFASAELQMRDANRDAKK